MRNRKAASLFLLVVFRIQLADAASFDCAKAHSYSERTICSDPALSSMDDELAALFRRAKAVALDKAAFKKQNEQRWLQREKTCSDRNCLVSWFAARRDELKKAAGIRTDENPNSQLGAAVTNASALQVESRATPEPRSSNSGSTPATPFVLLAIAGFVLYGFVRKAIAADVPSRSSKGPTRHTPGVRVANSEQIRKIETGTRHNVATKMFTATRWIPSFQPVNVGGLNLPGGMLYLGSSLVSGNGEAEPAQIDPSLEIAPNPVDPSNRLTDYWPSYSRASPSARKAYLSWLAGGRSDPSADIGYVFIFFYGLERRILVDYAENPALETELPLLRAEIQRLLAIYQSGSFQSYASQFLEFLDCANVPPRIYLGDPPDPGAFRQLPMRLRLGIGQAAVDKVPIPEKWAFAWITTFSNSNMPTALRRCPKAFRALFELRYISQYPGGLRLQPNRTKLKIIYNPASAALRGKTFSRDVGDLPDITAVVGPIKKLQAIVDWCAEALDSHSRYVGRNPEQSESLEAALLLPPEIWPESIRSALDAIDRRIGTGMTTIKLAELASSLGSASALTRDRIKALVHSLEGRNVGLEPDITGGARTPKPDDFVVLFRLNPGDTSQVNAASYEAAAVMLDLAVTLADADGDISAAEIRFLNAEVDAWTHLGAAAQRRLRARLRLLISRPPTLMSLKSRLETLPTQAKTALVKVVSTLAFADGQLDPSEVRHLEKVYKLLGIEASQLYSDLHVSSATAGRSSEKSAPVSSLDPVASLTPRHGPAAGLVLDTERIAARMNETRQVNALLTKVFEEELGAVSKPKDAFESAPVQKETATGPTLLGLDSAHSTFARILLGRPTWSRKDLEDAAHDAELMLDASLEKINDAALDQYGMPLVEGDDPMDIVAEVKEKLAA